MDLIGKNIVQYAEKNLYKNISPIEFGRFMSKGNYSIGCITHYMTTNTLSNRRHIQWKLSDSFPYATEDDPNVLNGDDIKFYSKDKRIKGYLYHYKDVDYNFKEFHETCYYQHLTYLRNRNFIVFTFDSCFDLLVPFEQPHLKHIERPFSIKGL